VDDFEKSLNKALIETFNIILKYEEDSLKKLVATPVTIGEAHIIEAIGQQTGGEATVSEIASAMNVSAPTATVAIKKLESKGYVKKSPCVKDGRKMLVSLTSTGEKIERSHRFFHSRMVRNISSQFQDNEKEILYKTINKLNNFFQEQLET